MKTQDLADILQVTEARVKEIKALIAGKKDPKEYSRVRNWINQCYNMPNDVELILEACNEVLQGFGVEYIAHCNDGFDYDSMYGLSYVNLGDTYKTTVIYNHAKEKFTINCWGNIVERSNNYI
jgi:hypothetical protein